MGTLGERNCVVLVSSRRDLGRYAGSLLHEITHAATHTSDVSGPFEEALTVTLGVIAAAALDQVTEPKAPRSH